jgi:hypothetical protein
MPCRLVSDRKSFDPIIAGGQGQPEFSADPQALRVFLKRGNGNLSQNLMYAKKQNIFILSLAI